MTKKINSDEQEHLIHAILKIQFDNDWTQAELAEKMKFSPSTMNRILRGRIEIAPVTRNRIKWFLEKYSELVKKEI